MLNLRGKASGKTSFVNVIGSGQVRSLHASFITRMLSRRVRVAQWSEEVVPTVAFNFRKVRRGNITLKIWDVAGALLDWAPQVVSVTDPCLAGQPRYRSIWERYCNGVDAIMCVFHNTADLCVLTVASSFVVDSSDVRVPKLHYRQPLTAIIQKEKFDTARFELHQLLSQPSLSGVPLLIVCSASIIPGTAFLRTYIVAAREQERPRQPCASERAHQSIVCAGRALLRLQLTLFAGNWTRYKTDQSRYVLACCRRPARY